MSNSFYGGRDGQPFVIKATFKTVQAMVDEFKRGPEYTAVNFGEYALIETEHKNNPENGRIFRRGYDYNNANNRYISSWTLDNDTNIFKENAETEPGGAIYVGQIVGPSGNAPHLHLLSTMDDVKKKYDEKKKQIEQAGEDGSIIHLGDNNAFGPNFDIKQGFGEASLSTVPNGLGNLVPGKDGEKFNDNIKWHYCSVRDENQQETDAYIGFEIPYTVIEWDAKSVSPYYNRSKENTAEFDNLGLVDDARTEEEKEHPFYQKWNINIPKGIHGQSIENIGIATTAEEISKVYTFDFIDKNAEDSRDSNTGLLKIKDYPGKDEDKSGGRQIIYCTVVDYDRVAAGDKYKIYLGDYNMIKEISLADDGTFTIDYTHEDAYIRGENTGENGEDERLTWITQTSLNPENGEFQITTNNGTKQTKENLTWVKKLTVDSDTGVLKTTTTTGDNEIEEQLHWIKEISIDGNTGVVTYTDVDDSITTNQLVYIKEASFDDESGIITLTRTDGSKTTCEVDMIKSISLNQETGELSIQSTDSASNKNLVATLDWVKSANLSEANVLTIDYVNAKDIKVNLKTPNRIYLESSKFKADYNDNTTKELGDFTDLQISCVAADSEENVDTNLKIGGLWFITEE